MPEADPGSDSSQTPAGDGEYEVKAGECIDSIAFANGHFWETLWNADGNAALREARDDPFSLLAGDRVHIPPIREKSLKIATDKHHRFRRRGVPSALDLCFKGEDGPLAGKPWVIEIDGVRTEGETDAEGRIKMPIPPDAKKAVLTLGGEDEEQESFDFDLGGVDPIETVSGVQGRLINLGYECEVTGEKDEATEFALEEFQKAMGQEPTGELTDDLRSRLKSEYGS